MLSTQARSAFVNKDDGRAGWCDCALETRLWLVCADDLPERIERSARRQLGAETRLSWKSSGLPTRVSRASVIRASAVCASNEKTELYVTRAETVLRQ